MAYPLARMAELLGGTLIGDGSIEISAALPIAESHPQAITFLAKGKSVAKLEGCRAGAVIVPPSFPAAEWRGQPLVIVDDPLAAILAATKLFAAKLRSEPTGIDPRSVIHPTARLGDNVAVGAFAVVEADVEIGTDSIVHPHAVVRQGCRLGRNVEIHPHAVLYPNTKVGDRTIVHAGVVLGCDGFGYVRKGVEHHKVPQLGIVEIGSDVEIGANSTIDRATLGTTRIGDGTKIDNLVMVGHNCQVGKHNIFVSQVGVGGSCTTGDSVVLAGQAGIADHVTIGANSVLGAKGGVFQDIPPNEIYLGAPARPEREVKRQFVLLERLPEISRTVNRLAAQMGIERGDDRMRRRAAG